MYASWRCIALAYLSQAAFAQTSSSEAYNFVEARREEARKLWSSKDHKGINILTETLSYLDLPLVRDLAAGDLYLSTRRGNVYLDLGEAHAVLGNAKDALYWLRQCARVIPDPGLVRFLESDPAFASMRSMPDFRAVLAEFSFFQRFWDSEEMDTPFRSELPEPERIAGLSKFWSEVKYNFGYPEKLVEKRWDQLYLDWIPKVMAARSTSDYYRQLKLLCARLEDGHTNVYGPRQLDDSSRPPLRTAWIEDRVMIVDVLHPSLEAMGIQAGMELVKVNGEPVIEFARREVEPFVSSSTPQDRQLRTFSYSLLLGKSTEPVRLTLRQAGGTESEHTLARSGYQNVRGLPPFEWKTQPGGIALVSLTSFENFSTAKQFIDQFPTIRESTGVILDIRRNGGGSSGVGYAILQRFIDKPTLGSRVRMRQYNPTNRARGLVMNWTELEADGIQPFEGPRFSGPVVVLSGAGTFSAAEDFLVAWKSSGRGKIIGERSGGSTGQPLFFTLPGGGSARVCTKKDTFPDGTEWVGAGIQPDIEVRQTRADLIAGIDTVLQRALLYLAKGE